MAHCRLALLTLILLGSLLATGCGNEKERGMNADKDRPKRSAEK